MLLTSKSCIDVLLPMIHAKGTIKQRNGKVLIELPANIARKLHVKNNDLVELTVESTQRRAGKTHYSVVDPREGKAFYRALEAMYGYDQLTGKAVS